MKYEKKIPELIRILMIENTDNFHHRYTSGKRKFYHERVLAYE